MIVTLSHSTPTERLETEVGPVLLKREDLNPTGSHKDRAARLQAAHYHSMGAAALVLSSSGNAARSAAAAASAFGMPVYAFMSKRTPGCKVRDVKRFGGQPILSEKPVNLARYVSRNYALPNLRPSRCAQAVSGFASLGLSIAERARGKGDFDSVFSFASSGASFVAIGEQLARLEAPPQVHAVQAGEVAPLVADDDGDERRGQAPRTGGLCAQTTPRAEAARALMAQLGGRGWLVCDDEVDAAIALLAASGRRVCREAGAAFAAAQRAQREGRVARPLVVLTGKALEEPEPCDPDEDGIWVLDDYLAAKAAFDAESQTWSS